MKQIALPAGWHLSNIGAKGSLASQVAFAAAAASSSESRGFSRLWSLAKWRHFPLASTPKESPATIQHTSNQLSSLRCSLAPSRRRLFVDFLSARHLSLSPFCPLGTPSCPRQTVCPPMGTCCCYRPVRISSKRINCNSFASISWWKQHAKLRRGLFFFCRSFALCLYASH